MLLMVMMLMMITMVVRKDRKGKAKSNIHRKVGQTDIVSERNLKQCRQREKENKYKWSLVIKKKKTSSTLISNSGMWVI